MIIFDIDNILCPECNCVLSNYKNQYMCDNLLDSYMVAKLKELDAYRIYFDHVGENYLQVSNDSCFLFINNESIILTDVKIVDNNFIKSIKSKLLFA